jgi:hypothetical protein
MKNIFWRYFGVVGWVNTIHSQNQRNKVGYIDMEYMESPKLCSNYSQLEQKAQSGKKNETKKIRLNKKWRLLLLKNFTNKRIDWGEVRN